MKNTHRTLAALVALLTPLAAHAAGPYAVLRATSPRDVATAPAAATVAVSPLEESASLLLDGSDYYYAVRDGSGTLLRISAMKNPVLGGVRISFDDGDPASAPVGAASSTVVLAPASIPADGMSLSTATIVPRDASGVVLGTGLSVEIEGAALWPGLLAGAVEDLGDGTYVATIVSSIPGAGSVRVRAEGAILSSEPTISFLNAGGSGGLREQARDLLVGLGAEDGPLASLQQSSGRAATAYGSALADIRGAAVALSPGDPTRDKQDAMHLLEFAIDSLLSAAANDPRAWLLIDDVLEAGRLLASYHAAMAETYCGACDGSKPRKTCAALANLAEGDALRATDPTRAIQAYTRAVDNGVQARTTCN